MQAQEERLSLKDAADRRSSELSNKITSMGESNMSMQGQAREVLIRMENKEQDMGTRNLELAARLEQRKHDTGAIQKTLNATADKLVAAQRGLQALGGESKGLAKRAQKLLEEADAAGSRTEETEHEISEGMQRNNVRSEFAEARIKGAREEARQLQEMIDAASREADAVGAEAQGALEEMGRCREAIAKLAQHQGSLRQRQERFAQLHDRAVHRARDSLVAARSSSHQALSHLGSGANADEVFAAAREVSSVRPMACCFPYLVVSRNLLCIMPSC